MDIQQLHKLFLGHPIVCTDTRNIIPGSVFFALKGENFNGNLFAEQALQKGCAYVIVDEVSSAINNQCVLVENVLHTLQQLAAFHRKYWGKQIIALTGTNGKTTTKELIHSVLAQEFKVLATKGNLNNHIGVPLTLLSLTQQHEIAIVEMGANHQKEIELLCEIAQPDFGVITNIGRAHLEGFGGVEGVKKGKGEMYDFVRKRKGRIFLNLDDQVLIQMSSGLSAISYGMNEAADIQGRTAGNSVLLELDFMTNGNWVHVKTNLTGGYNFHNALCAVACGHALGISDELIREGLEKYQPDNNRSQIKRTEKNILILDAYNANPSSMAAAFQNFIAIESENKFFIIGDMLELGEESADEHKNVLDFIQSKNLKGILVGKQFYRFKEHYPFLFFEEAISAREFLISEHIKNHLLLVKGSRGIKLETVIDTL
jgi:UDP-N-acetylmuramoyl-tripeptide--D-alanyl-D-alanine ligase